MTQLLTDTPQAANARAARQAAERARAYRERAAKAAAVEDAVLDVLAAVMRSTPGSMPTQETAWMMIKGATTMLVEAGWERPEAMAAICVRLGLKAPQVAKLERAA
jgi:hypothetical protein